MMPRPITPTFFLVRRAIGLSGLFPALPPVQPEAKRGIVQSRSSLVRSLERPQILGSRAKIDNQLFDRRGPFPIGQLDSDVLAGFVECFLPCLLDIDQFENVKAKPCLDRFTRLARVQFQRRLKEIRRYSTRGEIPEVATTQLRRFVFR